jgi:hypothetical protein
MKMKMSHVGWLENSNEFHSGRLWFANGSCGIITPFSKKSIVDVRADRQHRSKKGFHKLIV